MPVDKKISDIIIYTSTLYGNDETSIIRSKLCIKMLENARNLGIKVVVKDGGSNAHFISQLTNLKNVVLVQDESAAEHKSMGEDRRHALRVAMQIAEQEIISQPCFFWTEPEKDSLISAENLQEMMSELTHGANIVVPARKEKAWETLPKNQRWFEQRAERRLLKILQESSATGWHKEPPDLWFGPKMFDGEGAKYFLGYNKDKNRADLWDATIVPVVEAIKDGQKVSSIPVDYEYTEDQRDSESGELEDAFTIKRLEQYAQILKEMGDKKWVDFFESAKEELAAMGEIKKEIKNNPNNVESAKREKELKTEIIKKFQNG